MAKRKYQIEVLFSTPVYVTVKANDVYDAMAIAEVDATEVFRKNLDEGMLGVSDFYCEVQTP